MPVTIDFEGWVEKLKHRLTQPLPGFLAHDVMRATPVGSLMPKFEHRLPPKPGSVLILLYPNNGSIHFPLTLRADYIGAHSGQVSLPGGKTEAGEDYIQTALRECEEEIGVSGSVIEVIGRLSNFFVMPSNFMVVPVIGVSRVRPAFKADPIEVVKIIEGNVDDLIGQDAIKRKEILAAGKFRMMAPYFEIEGAVVWGATAMMLNEFRTILREIN